jgi:pilus assembly protein CpaF
VADRLFEGEAVLHVIERIVAPLGLRVDATSPWVDARLPDGSRVQTHLLNTPFPARHCVAVARLDGRSQSRVHHAVEPPAVGDALQLLLTAVVESQTGSRDEVLHRL